MEMLGILLLLLILASWILPWVNLASLRSRKQEIDDLRHEIDQLKRIRDKAAIRPEASELQAVQAAPEKIKKEREIKKPVSIREKEKTVTPPQLPRVVPMTPIQQVSDPVKEPEDEPIEASSDWFSKIVVWVGGIALLMAGFYMIKYSIESGWLTPFVRVCLTTLFGVSLSFTGLCICFKSKLRGTERVGQALSGAGVACLYFAVYAAVHLYGFLNTGQGFIGMLVVTVLAVMLSLRCGSPVALMGLVGGFLTPWLMATGSLDTVTLFLYLFLLYCGVQFLCLRRGWWGLLLVAVVGTYVWSGFVLLENFQYAERRSDGVMWFLFGICIVNSIWVFWAKNLELNSSSRMLLLSARYLVWFGGLIQSVFLLWMVGFSGFDMGLFYILSLAALLLAVIREDEFFWASWLGLAAVLSAMFMNDQPDLLSWFILPSAILLIYFVVAHCCGLKPDSRPNWRYLAALAIIALVPVLYLNREIFAEGASPFSSFWLVISLGCGALLILASEHLVRRDKTHLLDASDYQIFAVILISFGLWTYLSIDNLTYGLSALLVLSALNWKYRGWSRVDLMLALLLTSWTVVMFPRVSDTFGYFFRTDFGLSQQIDIRGVLAWMIGAIGGVVSLRILVSKIGQGSLIVLSWWAGLTILWSLVATYQYLDQSYMPIEWSGPAVEGGLTTLLAVFAVLTARLWSRSHRVARIASGVFSLLAGIRILFLHLLDDGAAGPSFFFNALFLQFAIPFFCAFALAWFASSDRKQGLRKVYQIGAMLLGFIWSSFLVQDYFGGADLFSYQASSTELYTYSVIWILLAVTYQAIGLWRDQKTIHIGSLCLLLITVAKVFLIDASELEGLYRVLSFLGLGIALIGIGYFYNRVVFLDKRIQKS